MSAPNGTWFDTTAFAQPTNVGFGNVTRNQFYGPGGKNFDFSLFRSFPLGGTRRLEARIQANNLFNWVVLRQSAEQHHVGHVRPDHRHRGRCGVDQRRVSRAVR